jgi:hypothetical protein
MLLKGIKEAAWEVFKVVVNNFLGKHKAPNYRTQVDTAVETFRSMGCNTSLKLHFLQKSSKFFKQP